MLRGNLDNLLRKLREGQFYAIVLAAAGLRRLDWAHEITEYLETKISLPAIGQGALGIEGRQDDLFIRSLLSGLDHAPSKTAILAERALLHRLQGGCQVPIAAYATVAGIGMRLEGLVSSVDGKELLRDTVEGTIEDPKSIGIQLADRLLARGGDKILQAIYGTT
jgi:hydroxymethylbilane synthase